jgi:diguanylate cyclase (GGDEF)-like protein
MPSSEPFRARVLVIDDQAAIHADFAKVLAVDGPMTHKPSEAEQALFGTPPARPSDVSFDVDYALQGREGLARVEAALREGQAYSVAFIDMRMPPGWDGLETIERIWAVDPALQIVICSAHSDYDWLDILSRLGCPDKLLVIKKPFETVEILQCANALARKWHMARALHAHVQTLEQMVESRTQALEAANRQLRHLATHDALTGLPNRVLLEDRFSQAVAIAKRQAGLFGLIVVDLDRFKPINDSFGHAAGDAVLREVAARLTGVVRGADTVARLGGDEFVVIVSPGSDRADVTRAAERIVEELRKPIQLADAAVYVTASVGCAFYPPDGSTMDELIAQADAAVYFVKERGRNSVQCYVPGMAVVT